MLLTAMLLTAMSPSSHRNYPHLTPPPQATIQIADNVAANSNAVAILRDSSFNGCFVGDDLVRNRAEWLAAGDTIRFGNDKEKFIVETIAFNADKPNAAMAPAHNPNLSPIQETNQHGGIAAGVTSVHGDRLHNLSDGSPTRDHYRDQYNPPPTIPHHPTQQQQQQHAAPPRPSAPFRSETTRSTNHHSSTNGQAWQISFPTAHDPNTSRRSDEFAAPPAPPALDPNASAFLNDGGDPYAPVNHATDEPILSDKARAIYGGTLGGAPSPALAPSAHPMSLSMPSMPAMPSSPPVAWGDVPLPVQPSAPLQPSLHHHHQQQQQQPYISGAPPAAAQPPQVFRDSLDDLPTATVLPDASLLPPNGDSHHLTATERSQIMAEKEATTKHLRLLNMLLGNTVDPSEVEFVFTEPETANLDNEADGMGRRSSSTGSLHSRMGRERAAMLSDSEHSAKELKRERDRQLVARSLGILEKHKIRGLQKGWNKWKLEISAGKMGLLEKERLATIEEEMKKKDTLMESEMLRQISENKQRSAIQLMIDNKKKGKQLQLRAGWNSWKILVSETKKNEFTKLLRSKDNANAMNRITALFKGSTNKKLYSAMNKWRAFIMSDIKRGGGESEKYGEVLKQRSQVLAKRVKELEQQVVDMSDELDVLKVHDWAQALSSQQKIMNSLRKQVGRAERGWAAESAAFAGACMGAMEYVPQKGMGEEGGKPGASGSGLAGVLQQRKIKQAQKKGGGTLKEKVLPPGTRGNSKVRQIQAYIVGKAREIASVRRESEEWRRRAEASGRNWSALATERDELLRAMEENKDSSVRQSAQLLSMVTERDSRIQKLQAGLLMVTVDPGKGEKNSNKENNGELKSALKGQTGAQTGAQTVAGQGGKTVKMMTAKEKKKMAAKFLAKEFNDMQAAMTDQCKSLNIQLIELQKIKVGGGVGSNSSSMVRSGLAAPDQDSALKCVALTNKVRRLEDELHEVEVQGGVRALVEAQELIECLQSELAINERKVRVVQAQMVRNKGGGDESGALLAHMLKGGGERGRGGGQLSARSNRSTPSQLPSALQAGVDEAWDLQLSETAKRLEDAEEGYEKELEGSGLLRRDADDYDDGGSRFGDDDEEE